MYFVTLVVKSCYVVYVGESWRAGINPAPTIYFSL